MESKKINQLATEMAPAASDLTIIGDPITGVSKKITLLQLSTTIGAGADLQGVTDNGASTTNPIFIGGLTITGLATGALLSTSGVISSVPYGAANGVATLGGDGKVPSNQLPSYVDDVVEVANFAALPATGETGKLYVTLDNNKVYRWTGSTYVEIAANNAVWGAITGTLSNQTDLQSALNAKVPYTGATADVNLGTYDLTTDIATLNQVKAVGSGGISFNANSGTQVAAMGSGGGANMTLYGGLNGTSASFSSSITGNTIVKSGGTSSQFLKADGSIDSNTYLTTSGASSTYVDLTSNQTIAGIKTFSNTIVANDSVYFAAAGTAVPTIIKNISGTGLVSTGANGLGFNSNNDLYFSGTAKYGGVLSFTNTQINTYTLQNSSGTIAFTGDLHNPVTIGTANGLSLSTQVLSLALATTSTNGALSSTDWNTFNGKQAALSGTGFVKISGTTISYDNSTYLTTSAAASTYLPLSGGTLTGPLNINLSSATGLNVASDSVIFRGNTGIGSPRQLVFSSGGGPTTLIEAKGYGANYNTDLSLKTYNSSGTGFDVFFATSAGNVGIGNTAPAAKLDVNGTFKAVGAATFSSTVAINGANHTSELNIFATSQPRITFQNSGANRAYISADGGNTIYNSLTGNGHQFQIDGSVKVAITGAGNVGIGTSSPTNKLDVRNGGDFDVKFRSEAAGGTVKLLLETANTFSGTSQAYVGVVGSGGNGTSQLIFGTSTASGDSSASEKMRLTNTGDLGLGTTSPISGGSAAKWFTLNGTTAANYSGGLVFAYNSTAKTYQYWENGNFKINNGTGGVYLATNGTAWLADSDENLKTDLLPIEDAANKVCSLRSVIGRYKMDEVGTKRAFLIAQDVIKVLPEAVAINQENGNLGVSYTEVIPLLVAAIKEQQAQIEELKAKIK